MHSQGDNATCRQRKHTYKTCTFMAPRQGRLPTLPVWTPQHQALTRYNIHLCTPRLHSVQYALAAVPIAAMYTCRSARVQAAVYCSVDLMLAEQAADAKLVTAVAPADQAHSQTVSASHALAAAREAEISVMRSLQCELRRCDQQTISPSLMFAVYMLARHT